MKFSHAVVILLLSTRIFAQDPTLTDANKAFEAHQIDRAARLYGEVASSATDPAVRSDAKVRAAMLAWRYERDFSKAEAILLDAISSEEDIFDFLVEWSDLELGRDRYVAAREAALEALLSGSTDAKERAARLRWARAAAEELLSSSTVDRRLARQAVGILVRLVRDEAGQLEPSRLLLTAALVAGDGEAALEGWRSYYRVAEGGEPYTLLRDAYATLRRTLPGWTGADARENASIVRALGASRFFREAAAVARIHGLPEPAPKDLGHLLAYADLIEEIESVTNEHYRLTSIGDGRPQQWMRSLLTSVVSRWDALGLPGMRPEVTGETSDHEVQAIMARIGPGVEASLGERFGSYINVGTTAGYLDLHMGHEIEDLERSVEQYGRSAEVRFIVLDHMVSNGFQSWAWAFRSQHGGWAKPEAIYDVRPSSADKPVRLWQKLTNPDQRAEWDEEIRRDTLADDDQARRDALAYLPGLEKRLEQKALQTLYDRLKAEGHEQARLRTAFLRAVEQAIREGAIFAHEGRHVIDKREGIDGSEELEFRAKLSEIVFAPMPCLSLAGPIISPNVGDHTPHGQANLRVLRALVAWMEENRDEISGLDPSRPLLPQLDLLTPDQLRSAARNADPLAPKH